MLSASAASSAAHRGNKEETKKTQAEERIKMMQAAPTRASAVITEAKEGRERGEKARRKKRRVKGMNA